MNTTHYLKAYLAYVLQYGHCPPKPPTPAGCFLLFSVDSVACCYSPVLELEAEPVKKGV